MYCGNGSHFLRHVPRIYEKENPLIRGNRLDILGAAPCANNTYMGWSRHTVCGILWIGSDIT
jgi:hypothetical protein